MMISILFNIIFKTLRLDKNFYNNNKNYNESSIYFSIIIVLITSLISIIPNDAFLEYLSLSFNLGGIDPPKLRAVIITSIIVWLIKTSYLFVVGTILFPNKSTNCSFKKIMITVGYAHSPLILNLLIFNASFLLLTIVFYIWYSASLIVGINQILKYNNLLKSTIVVMAPIIIFFIYTIFQLMSLQTGTVS